MSCRFRIFVMCVVRRGFLFITRLFFPMQFNVMVTVAIIFGTKVSVTFGNPMSRTKTLKTEAVNFNVFPAFLNCEFIEAPTLFYFMTATFAIQTVSFMIKVCVSFILFRGFHIIVCRQEYWARIIYRVMRTFFIIFVFMLSYFSLFCCYRPCLTS